MKSFEYSGSPHSEINKARWAYHMARYFALPSANAGKIPKGEAMAMLNKARSALRTAAYGSPEKHYPDIKAKVSGIPCGVAAHFSGDNLDFIILDRRGYRAKWLEDKITESEREEIMRKINQMFEEQHEY